MIRLPGRRSPLLGASARHRLVALAAGSLACGGSSLDAGRDQPHGLLPVDERNPVVVVNDGYTDNWQGEQALLLANSGTTLAGIVVTDSGAWPNLDTNLAGWQAMVNAARASGMKNAPDPIASSGPPLVRPADGNVDSTQPNGSAGAHFLIDAAQRLSLPYRPLVVAFGTRLTDAADAYLLDHTLPDRVVVVASLGTGAADGGAMGIPNGEMDPWADAIVVQKFRYVQVSAYYDQTADVSSSRIPDLPNNAFGAWIASKQPQIWNLPVAADQVSILASAVPSFVLEADRVSQDGWTSLSGGQAPTLGADPSGDGWLVTRSAAQVPSTRLWQGLLDPKTFGQ